MGTLTEDMTRVCGEIRAMRASRQALRDELAEGAKERRVDVIQTCTSFAEARARMAKQTKEARGAFWRNLKRTVAGQQRELRADIAGARRAWAGKRA